ncbi:MAG TPA: hypothetical protein VH092_30455 [Urbifossiella sp.]|jgi:hypothetical protein|nr:hypothetical protein [Urbifossiella sp.]
MRCAAVAVVAIALQAAGCLTAHWPLGGRPPADGTVAGHDSLSDVAQKSLEAHLAGVGWRPSRCTNIPFDDDGREWRWSTEFTCQKHDDHADGPVCPLPESEYVRVLVPVRADILAAVEKSGVEVNGASPVEYVRGIETYARFEIRYLRETREVAGVLPLADADRPVQLGSLPEKRQIAGVLVGMIRPSVGRADRDTRYTVMSLTSREWYTR